MASRQILILELTRTAQFEDVVVLRPHICLFQCVLETPVELGAEHQLTGLVTLSLVKSLGIVASCLPKKLLWLVIFTTSVQLAKYESGSFIRVVGT